MDSWNGGNYQICVNIDPFGDVCSHPRSRSLVPCLNLVPFLLQSRREGVRNLWPDP